MSSYIWTLRELRDKLIEKIQRQFFAHSFFVLLSSKNLQVVGKLLFLDIAPKI